MSGELWFGVAMLAICAFGAEAVSWVVGKIVDRPGRPKPKPRLPR